VLLATWNGGAPNAIVKKIIPREKMSAASPLKGVVLALCTSGAMYAFVPNTR